MSPLAVFYYRFPSLETATGLTALVLLSVLPLAVLLPDSQVSINYRFSGLQYSYRTHRTRSTIGSPACNTATGLTGLVLLSVLPLAILLPDSRDSFYYRFSCLP